MTDAKPAVDPTKAAGEAEVDDGQYAERSELVAVQEWYCRERIEFEQKVLEKIEIFKKTGKFEGLFPAATKGKKGKGKKADGTEKQKRTISAYNLFIRYEIEDMKANNLIPPNSKITDTIRGLGQTWTNMEADAKASKSKTLFLRHQKDHPEFVIPAEIMAATDEEPAKKKGKKTK